jgi:uncharacterized protein YggU (UPF0235/DUF167 family)
LTLRALGAALPWVAVAGGLRIKVRLTPKGGQNRVEGLTTAPDGTVLKVRVRALPENGAANAALTKVLAGWLGVPQASVAVIGGAKARGKTLMVAGDGLELAKRASARLADGAQHDAR